MPANLLLICHRCPLRGPVSPPRCLCTVDGVDIIIHTKQTNCPKGYFNDVPLPVAPLAITTPLWYAGMWSELHARPLLYAKEQDEEIQPDDWKLIDDISRAIGRNVHEYLPRLPGDAMAELAWLSRWSMRVRQCGGCMSHWATLLTDRPPDLSSPEAYARWGWGAHNAVNVHIGKPLYDFSNACEQYGYPVSWNISPS